jgi:hypothetical protein
LENYSEIDFDGNQFHAMMVRKNQLEESFGGILTKVQGRTLEEAYGVCANEPNAQDLTIGKCTGFLVGPDLLVTAGHCVTSDFSCKEDYKWIFEFRDDLILKVEFKVSLFRPFMDAKNLFIESNYSSKRFF